MVDEISVTCFECGKALKIPEYSIYGLPYEFLRCGCTAETKLNPRRMNSRCWEWTWMDLLRVMKKEFGNSVEDRLIKYIIERRNYYIKDRERPREDVFEPRSLKKSKTDQELAPKQDKSSRTRDRNEGFIPR